jgi:hypothetical protein
MLLSIFVDEFRHNCEALLNRSDISFDKKSFGVWRVIGSVEPKPSLAAIDDLLLRRFRPNGSAISNTIKYKKVLALYFIAKSR